MITHRVVLGIFIVRFLTASGQGAVYTFLPILALQLALTSSQVGIILGANIFLIAFLQRTCGALADRVNPKYLITTGTLASGMTVLGMPFVEGFTMILSLNILMGMANGVSLPGGLVITGKLGRTMGMASLMLMRAPVTQTVTAWPITWTRIRITMASLTWMKEQEIQTMMASPTIWIWIPMAMAVQMEGRGHNEDD